MDDTPLEIPIRRQPLQPSEVLRRAKSTLGWLDDDGKPPIYRLKHPNGGRNPDASHPFDRWGGRAVSDCVGFALWCLGIHRKRPGYNRHGSVEGWVNTDSLFEDATGKNDLVRRSEHPIPGFLLVYPGRRAAGIRIQAGHVGVLTSIPAELKPFSREWWVASKAIHCSSGNVARLGTAVAETSAVIWARRGIVIAWGAS